MSMGVDAQAQCAKAAGGVLADARHIRCHTPPLHTRPIDPSSWPPIDNLVSPCSPCARGAMHLPTSCSVRSSSLARPLLTAPRVLCTLARSLSWCGALWLSLWHAALRHTASSRSSFAKAMAAQWRRVAACAAGLPSGQRCWPCAWWPYRPSLVPLASRRAVARFHNDLARDCACAVCSGCETRDTPSLCALLCVGHVCAIGHVA